MKLGLRGSCTREGEPDTLRTMGGIGKRRLQDLQTLQLSLLGLLAPVG